MNSFLRVCLLLGICLLAVAARAEEKPVTTPLLTALSSTTISGYVDGSTGGTTNVSVSLPNGKTSNLTPRDVLALRWAVQHEDLAFLRLFLGVKEKKASMDANEFDAKFFPMLLRFSAIKPQAQSLLTGHSASPF